MIKINVETFSKYVFFLITFTVCVYVYIYIHTYIYTYKVKIIKKKAYLENVSTFAFIHLLKGCIR